MTRSNVQLGGQELKLDADADTSITADTDDQIDFKTGGSDRMHLVAEKLGIGESAPSSDLVVKQSGSTFTAASQTVALFQRNSATGSGCKVTILSGNNTNAELNFGDAEDEDIGKVSYAHSNNSMRFHTNTTEHFRIASNGTLTGTDTSISSNSDERLKKNISDYTYDLEKFKQYKPKTFDWKNPSTHNGKTGNRGFLAQDVKSIDDKWVGEIEIDEESPDYNIIEDNLSLTSKLGDKDAMYISIIQQLIAKVETLEAKVTALEST